MGEGGRLQSPPARAMAGRELKGGSVAPLCASHFFSPLGTSLPQAATPSPPRLAPVLLVSSLSPSCCAPEPESPPLTRPSSLSPPLPSLHSPLPSLHFHPISHGPWPSFTPILSLIPLCLISHPTSHSPVPKLNTCQRVQYMSPSKLLSLCLPQAAEFIIDETFTVPGVGTVVAGTVSPLPRPLPSPLALPLQGEIEGRILRPRAQDAVALWALWRQAGRLPPACIPPCVTHCTFGGGFSAREQPTARASSHASSPAS